VLTFSCGHEALEVEARRFEETARRDPNVERRQSDETFESVDTEGGRP
jgi:hypothetical protein